MTAVATGADADEVDLRIRTRAERAPRRILVDGEPAALDDVQPVEEGPHP